MKLKITAIAVMAALGSHHVIAEEADSNDVERIEVTGIRGSLIKSQDLKQEADTIVDAIVASEIGDFPDHNIADTLQRMTGIQIDRERGTATRVSIRGLPSSFTKVLYNGHSISSIAVGDSPLREFSFNSLPSDFASAISVSKSSSADLPEGGLSGTVNLRTHRAFDSDKPVYVFNANTVYDQKSEDYSPEFTGLWSDTFNDKLGVTLGVNYVEQNQGVQRSRQNALGTRNESSDGIDYNVDGDMDDKVVVSKGMKYEAFPINRKRTSAIANFEYRADDGFNLFGELFYSKLDIKANRYELSIDQRKQDYLDGTSPTLSTFSSVDGDGNPVTYEYVDAAHTSGFKAGQRTQGQLRDGDMLVGILEANYDLGDWSITPSASFTKSKTSLTKWNVVGNTLEFESGVYVNVATQGDSSQVIFDDPSALTDLSQFSFKNAPATDFYRNVENSTYNLRLDVSRNLETRLLGLDLNRISFGVNFSEDKVTSDGADLAFANASYFSNLGINPEEYFTLVEHDKAGAFYGPDVLKMLENFSEEELKAAGAFTYDEQSQIDIKEKSTAAFAKLDFSSASTDWSGNIGVRYVSTDEYTSGWTGDPSGGFTVDQSDTLFFNIPEDKVVRDRTYSEWLPSFNLRYSINDDQQLRFAANRTLTRADFDDLSIYVNAKTGLTSNRLNYADPNIEPWVANNMDLAYEWYFSEDGMFSTTLFYKDLKSLTADVKRTEMFDVTRQQVDADGFLVFDNGQPVMETAPEEFEVTGTSNVDGLTVKGAEVSLVLPFTGMPSFLEDMGVNTNYTYVENSKPQLLRGSSKHNYNAMLYYSVKGFNAKVSYTYRDQYLREVEALPQPATVNIARGNLSASVKVKVFDGVSLKLSGTNLTGESDAYYQEGVNWTRQYIDYGRRFTFGIMVKL